MEETYNEETGSDTDLVCRAKEVVLESVTSPVAQTCKKGEKIIVDLVGSILLTTERYDFGWYIATDGGDALTGTCAVKSLVAPTVYNLTSGEISWTEESDVCGDIFAPSTSPVKMVEADLAKSLEITCQDINNDGYLDVSFCFSWRDRDTNDECHPMALYPGSPTKCDCATYDVERITVVTNKTHSTCI